MPVQYSSIIEEHRAVREAVGLFDISHMGEILASGRGALAFLEKLTCNTIAPLAKGHVHYNTILNENGGIVDDLTIYRIDDDIFFIVSNAANYEKVFAHMRRFAEGDVALENQSDAYALLALQGPRAVHIIGDFAPEAVNLPYYQFVDATWNGQTIRISRTGYTGTDGFELYVKSSTAVDLWDALITRGKSSGLKPAGLGARDILRLEAGMPLWGNELNETWTPIESGVSWIVKEKNPPYLGYDRIMEHKKNGPPGRVVRFVMIEKGGIPRGGYPVFAGPGTGPIGKVLSGAHSPALETGIGTTYLAHDYNTPGTEILIGIRDRRLRARIHRGPFIEKTAGKT